jgi:CBS domain-containing protein
MMKVREVMTRPAVTCAPTTDLVSCARKMWDGDFGFLPVVSERGQVVGVVTDRDICMAVAMQDRRPSDIPAREVMTREARCCSVDDTIDAVMHIMRDQQVRRLPVTNAEGVLQGVVSVNDLALSVSEPGVRSKAAGIPPAEVLTTVRAIAHHRATVDA